jgi:ABC-type antimicrobial peptide transport system ATPase subunit
MAIKMNHYVINYKYVDEVAIFISNGHTNNIIKDSNATKSIVHGTVWKRIQDSWIMEVHSHFVCQLSFLSPH